jgi:hypothetical protein
MRKLLKSRPGSGLIILDRDKCELDMVISRVRRPFAPPVESKGLPNQIEKIRRSNMINPLHMQVDVQGDEFFHMTQSGPVSYSD